LHDIPNDRKIHKNPTPSLGGLAMFIGLVISLLFSINFTKHGEFQYYIAAFLILLSIGLKDDIFILDPFKKLLGQIVAVSIILYKCHLVMDNLQGLFGIHALPMSIAYGFTFLFFLFVINAFNLIDGVDGLAGSLALLAALVFGIYFYINGYTAYAILATGLSGSIIAFLFFNIQPAKIFMGDTGSLLLGLCIAIMAVKFIEIAQSTATVYAIASAPVVCISVIIIPILDTLRVFIIRSLKRRSPFSPDKSHLHHILLNKGLSHNLVTLTCVFISLVFIILSFLGQHLDPTILFMGLIILSIGGISIIQAARSVHRPTMRVVQGEKRSNLLSKKTGNSNGSANTLKVNL